MVSWSIVSSRRPFNIPPAMQCRGMLAIGLLDDICSTALRPAIHHPHELLNPEFEGTCDESNGISDSSGRSVTMTTVYRNTFS